MAKANPLLLFTLFSTCFALRLHGAASFSLKRLNSARTQRPTAAKSISPLPQQPSSSDEGTAPHTAMDEAIGSPLPDTNDNLKQLLLTGCIAFLTTTPLSAIAVADELEIAELPPVYVPILFAIGVLGGVGVLTASLGNVMDEEASLGLQSGARAKKERDRSRSSYFKK